MMKKFIKQLLSTDEKELQVIANLERQGKFNDHTSVGGFADYDKVGADFKYIPKCSLGNFILEQVMVKPFVKTANKILKTEVVGTENLQGLNGAIVCCNHINRLDCCAIFKALSYKKTYVSAAEFNNYKGILGKAMRIGGMLPMSSSIGGMKNFKNTIATLLKKGNYVVVYPEAAEWWCYKKPRPLFEGAFKFALDNNVPVLPLFITFKDTEESLASPLGLPQFVVNILPPVYADPNKDRTENVAYIKEKVENSWQDCYNRAYLKD